MTYLFLLVTTIPTLAGAIDIGTHLRLWWWLG